MADTKDAIRRRRECQACGRRFTTYERCEEMPLVVVKTSGERQGTFFIRWMCPRYRPPAPTCRVVSLGELRA